MKHDRGSMSVEAVLLVPLLVTLVLFVVHLGRLGTIHLRLVTTADQAARAASLVHPQLMSTAVEVVARQQVIVNQVPCESLDVQVRVARETDPGTISVTLSCRVSREGLGLLLPVARTVEASSSEVIDRWRVDS